MANGHLVYDGPSQINGQRIRAIVTNTAKPSANSKTGPMAQLWILPASHPVEAAKAGQDASVCGTCPRRPSLAALNGLTPCYVTLAHGPSAVWRAHARAPYSTINTRTRTRYPVRLGAWGDPAALPIDAIRAAVALSGGKWTGYTHAWRTRPDLKPYCMASCDTASDVAEAQALGWRTFAIRKDAASDMPPDSIACPASAESGKRTTCDRCGLCNGRTHANDRRKSIAIIAH